MKTLAIPFWPATLIAVGIMVFIASLFLNEKTTQQDLSPLSPASQRTFMPRMSSPANNLPSPEKQELGRQLFYDTALSVNNTIACSSCHQQDKAFTDGKALSSGATGELTGRNAMSLANVGFNAAFTWADSSVRSLEQQALIPLMGLHPLEMGVTGHEDEILDRLRAKVHYPPLFSSAFPGERQSLNWENIVKAIATFQRALLSYGSPYDHYVAGDKKAISATALRGKTLFLSRELNCSGCHGGHNFRFTLGHRRDNKDRSVAFHNTGLYNLNPIGDYPQNDRGLMEVSGLPQDMGKFKTPTLRNVALTAPYMHDGSMETLTEVVQHYARGGRLISQGPNAGDGSLNPLKSPLITGFELSAADEAALIEFLGTLTDQHFITNPRFSSPAGEKL